MGRGRPNLQNKTCHKYDRKKNDIVGFLNPFFLHKQSNIAWMNRKTNKKNPERGNLGSNPKTTVCKARLKTN